MSIDSHFEVAENKEDSVHLHLPNYKGNQPMDFHIYLMEPFLFISFVTEVEGEKVSVVNSYPQDMDQQDMFNAAMASNLERIHEAMKKKTENGIVECDSKQEPEPEIFVPKEYTKAIEPVGTTWSFEDFIRMHGEYDAVVMADSKHGVLEYGVFGNANKHIVACVSDVVKKYSGEEFEKNRPNLEVVVLDSGMYCVCPKWKDVPLDQQADIWIDEYGVQYDREQRLLLKAPKDIEKYIIAEGTKTIGNAAFSNCEQLRSVILPDSVTKIGHYAFAGCKSIYSFAIPNRVTKLGNGVFMDCSGLSSIRMPTGLSNVERDIFQGCGNLNSVFVPKDCKYKYDELLYGHDAITYEYNSQSKDEVGVLDRILHGIVDESGVLYDFEGNILISATRKIETYSVKPDTIGIRVEAFKPKVWHDDGKSLKRLYLPDSITMIGDAAFAYNEALEYINIPENAAFFIDDNPFAGCKNLHTIKWETEKAVKEGTLVYNQERTALIACLPWHYIDGIVKSWPLLNFARQHGKMQVGEFKNKQTGELFKSCIFTNPHDSTRTFVAFSDAMGVLTPKEIAAQKNELTVVQLESGNYSLCKGRVIIEQDSQVEVPYGVKTIAAHAFYRNEVLQEITLPATIEVIGEDVFEGCSSLRAIYIPKDLLLKFEKMLTKWRHLLLEQKDLLPF